MEKCEKKVKKCRNDFALQFLPLSFSLNNAPSVHTVDLCVCCLLFFSGPKNDQTVDTA